MEYINTNRELGLSGLMRVMNDAQTLASSIDSCVEALDELIITYNDCTDESPQIIEQKRQQYPDKIIVLPYPYHVLGINLSDEEYEFAKALPEDSPHLLASYYNNALKHVNYKYVVKIDADQIYFTDKLRILRDDLVKGVKLSFTDKIFGKFTYSVFCTKRGNWRIWSKYHPIHHLQYVFVPMFKKQYYKFAVNELLQGKAHLSFSGINIFLYDNIWHSPLGVETKGAKWWPYNGVGDTLVFEASEDTYYVPWDKVDYQTTDGKHTLIEKFQRPKLEIGILGYYWFHLKLMQKDVYDEIIKYSCNHKEDIVPVGKLSELSFNEILEHLEEQPYRKSFFNFVHNYDHTDIQKHNNILQKYKFNK